MSRIELDIKPSPIDLGATGIAQPIDVTTNNGSASSRNYGPDTATFTNASGVRVTQTVKSSATPLAPDYTPKGQFSQTGAQGKEYSATLPEIPVLPPVEKPGAIVETPPIQQNNSTLNLAA